MDIKNMAVEQKIGQLIMAGIPSHELNEYALEIIEKYKIGNIILFKRNIREKMAIAELTGDIQKYVIASTGIPAFISIDQEGGMVTRIYEGAALLPGNMAFSAAGDDLTRREGEISGEELRALGINMNLAPVLDVNNNSKNPVIGVRSYSDDPHRAAELGVSYIKGIQSRGVIATAKHFPGHGDTEVDSHLALPLVPHNLERLEKVELYPFQQAIDNGVDAIMSAHVLFPAIEEQKLPGTLSYKVLTGLLRDKMGFKGIIMTDCMEMKAIAAHYGTANAAVMAIRAGADIVCVSHHLELQIDAFNAIKEAVLNGSLPESRIDESVERILRLKEKYNLFSSPYPDIHSVLNVVGSRRNVEFARSVSNRSITVVKDNNKLLPVKYGNNLIISTSPVVLTGADDDIAQKGLFSEAVRDRLGGRSFAIPLNPDQDIIDEIIYCSKSADTVIVGTYNANLNEGKARLVNGIYKVNNNVIVVALRNPYDILMFESIPAYICAYEYTPLSVESVIDVLAGEKEASGKLPVTIGCRLD